MSNLACRCAQRACASCVQVLVEFFHLLVGMALPNSGAVSSLAVMCRHDLNTCGFSHYAPLIEVMKWVWLNTLCLNLVICASRYPFMLVKIAPTVIS